MLDPCKTILIQPDRYRFTSRKCPCYVLTKTLVMHGWIHSFHGHAITCSALRIELTTR